MSRAISMPPPALPASVGAAGQLTVDVIVDTQGRVKCARATEGHPLLQSAATEAVRKWNFRPLSAGGQPVAVYGHLEITFYK
jgi:protein TonB